MLTFSRDFNLSGSNFDFAAKPEITYGIGVYEFSKKLWIFGSNRDDVFSGNSKEFYDQKYCGFGGNDTFLSSNGSDFYYGGADIDTVDYSTSDAGVTVHLSSGGGYGGHAQGDRYDSIENVVGSDHSDRLRGTSSDNTIDGGDGVDTLYGYSGNDKLYGGADDDILYGGSGRDKLFGGKGNDILFGDQDDDELFGGAGADTFVFRNAERPSPYDPSGPNVFLTPLPPAPGYVYSHGSDTIHDFEIGVDKIDISGTILGTSYSDPKSGFEAISKFMEQDGDNVTINTLADDDTITVLNVDLDDLSTSDFIF